MPRRRKTAPDVAAMKARIVAALRAGPVPRSDLYEALHNNVNAAELDVLLDALRRDGLVTIDNVLKTYTYRRLSIQVALTPAGERAAGAPPR